LKETQVSNVKIVHHSFVRTVGWPGRGRVVSPSSPVLVGLDFH